MHAGGEGYCEGWLNPDPDNGRADAEVYLHCLLHTDVLADKGCLTAAMRIVFLAYCSCFVCRKGMHSLLNGGVGRPIVKI